MSTGADKHLLLTFCNQAASFVHSICVLAPYEKRIAWIDLEPLADKAGSNWGGVCGACRVGDYVALCTQSVELPWLALIEIATGRFTAMRPLEGVRDPHSMVFHEGHIYFTSTGTNGIFRTRLDGGRVRGHEVFWQYPGTESVQDEVHLNGITISENGFIISCFGHKNANGSWGKEGTVSYLDSATPIRDQLDQPHTPVVFGGRLYFAESGSGKLWVCERSENAEWHVVNEISVGGYTRGITGLGNRAVVGSSAKRKVSRSKRTGLAETIERTTTGLSLVDPVTGEIESLYDLAAVAREIYDIVPIEPGYRLQAPIEALESRVQEMEDTVDRLTVQSQSSLSEAAKVNSILSTTERKCADVEMELQRSKMEREQLENELNSIYASNYWRVVMFLRRIRRIPAALRARLMNRKRD
jgi:hypothetical protein